MKRLLFIALICSTFCQAQVSGTFLQNESEAAKSAASKTWDNTLILAAELLIEEPLQPAGYYYSALGYFKRMDPFKAQQYVRKAFVYGDDGWKEKAKALERQIESMKKLLPPNFTPAQAASLSAHEWQAIWELDRTEIDFALNAVERFMQNNQIASAAKILDDPLIRYKPGVATLRMDFKEDKTVQVNDALESHLSTAKDYEEEGNYVKAIPFYEKALKLQPNNFEIEKSLRFVKEEAAWQNATRTKTVEAYEEYLAVNYFNKYRDRAFAQLVDLIKIKIKDLAARRKVADAEAYYALFIKRYSLSKKSKEEIDAAMCAMYHRTIEFLSTRNNVDEKQEMLETYYKARKICVLTDAQKKEITKLEKLLRK